MKNWGCLTDEDDAIMRERADEYRSAVGNRIMDDLEELYAEYDEALLGEAAADVFDTIFFPRFLNDMRS